MRTLMWAGLGVGVMVGLLGAAAFGALHYIQNNDMRGWASWGAARAGVPVTFNGPVEVKLWPLLTVKTQGVTVGAMQGEGTLATLDALAMQAAWGDGLRPWEGLQLRAVEAKNPSVTLVRQSNGMANWEVAAAPTAASSTAAATTEANPLAQLTATGGMLASLRLAIQNLNLSYTDATSGQQVVVAGMNIGARTEGSVATTTLRGTLNQQPVNGELVADVADLKDVPLKARLEGAGAALNLNGRVTAQAANGYGFAGLVNARSGNLKQTLTSLLGKAPAQAPASQASLTGDVVLLPATLTLRNFSARLGDLLQARGDIDVAMGAQPRGNGTLTLQGANLRALAELGLGAAQPMLPARAFTLQAKLDGEDRIVVRDVQFGIENLLKLEGQLSLMPKPGTLAGTLPDLDTKLTLNVPNFATLMRAIGQQGAMPSQPLVANVTVQGRQGIYTLQTMQAALADLATLAMTGTVGTGTARPTIALDATLEGANMAAAGAGFGVMEGLPTSGFSLRSKVRGSGPYELEGLTVNLPGLVQLLANLTVTPGTPTNLQGDIKVSQLNATRLGLCAEANAAAASTPVTTAQRGVAAGAGPLSNTPLNLASLRELALNLAVQAQGLTCANVPLKAAQFKVKNTPSQLNLEDIDLDLAGGRIAGTLQLSHAGTPQLNTKLSVNALALQALVPALAARGVVLPIDGTIDLTSQGISTLELAQNLNGLVMLAATEGTIPYGAMLGNMVALERVLQGQAQLPSNGDGRLEQLNLGLRFNQGLGQFAPFTARTAGGAMTLEGTGTLDLPNWAIDLTLTPKFGTSGGLAVPVLVRGPLTAPAIGADPAFTERLTRRLATEGIKSLLGLDKEGAQGLGGVVGDVLGGKGITQEGVGALLNQFVKPKPEAKPATPAPAAPATAPAAAQPTPESLPVNSSAEPNTSPQSAPTLEQTLEQNLPSLIEGVLGQ